MPISVFTGLALACDGGSMEVRCPPALHDVARARSAAAAHRLPFSAARDGTWGVRAPASSGTCPRALKAFFAELSGFPPPYAEVPAPLVPDAAPLVSCIIVVNQNALFVREQLLPSLVVSSRPHPIEVLLVHNGSPASEAVLAGFGGTRSSWGAVSAAYNAGAARARGRYLALFHDDCIVDDPLWIDKCLGALERGAAAVAGEFRRLERIAGLPVPALPVAKCVPLFIAAADFSRTGGFDEFHYVGYEDLDLTLWLAQHGRRVEAIDIRLRHFDGMSSTLKYCPIAGLDALYAMTAVPRVAIIRRFKEFAQAGLRRDGVDYLRLALDAQLFHVLMKYREYLATIDRSAYAQATEQLARALERSGGGDPASILPRFKALDREREAAVARAAV